MERTERCNETYKKLYNKARRTKNSTDPELLEIMQKFEYGDVYNSGDLDYKCRELIIICLITAQETPRGLKSHIFAALNVGVSPLEIREAIYQCATYIGFPRVLSAVGIMNEAFAEKSIEVPLKGNPPVADSERFEKGKEIESKLLGNTFEQMFKDLPENYGEIIPKYITEVCFGDFYTRGALDVATRELLMFAVVACVGVESHMRLHAKANQEVGNYKETLIASMVQAMPYIGFPRALNAIKILDAEMDY